MKCLSENELEYLERITIKLSEVSIYLQQENFAEYPTKTRYEQFNSLKNLRRILGNIDNDMSFMGCLLMKEFLQAKHEVPDLNMAAKAQGAPGLDLDVLTLDGKRIIGELKTTYPYQQHDFGAQQKVGILNDFSKLHRHNAKYKYFFVTELKAFNILQAKYSQYLNGVQLVLLGNLPLK